MSDLFFIPVFSRIEDDGPVFKDDENRESLVPADSVIIAISQVPQDRIVTREKDLKLNEKGNLATDSNGETSLPGVFASGDVVTGAKTVVAAVAVSKQIAEDMDRYMKSKKD